MAKMIINGEVYSGSTNYASAITYIKEDGTKSTVQKELDSRPVNNNILINSNFANPVNQRNITELSQVTDNYKYFIDRWCCGWANSEFTAKLVDGGVQIINNSTSKTANLFQRIEFPEQYLGKYVTLQVCIDNTVYVASGILPDSLPSDGTTFAITNNCTSKYNLIIGLNDCFFAQVEINSGYTSGIIQWAKLELGEVATPYVPRLYDEELRLCKRYYQKIYIGVPITQISTDSLQSIVFIPCEEMSLDKPRIDATNLRISANGVGQGDIILSNCAIITSQCKFYIKFDKASHGLTVSNNLSVQGLLIMDAEL